MRLANGAKMGKDTTATTGLKEEDKELAAAISMLEAIQQQFPEPLASLVTSILP